ncbi:MAG: ribosome-associated translation inhibitor RaiA [Candidatus Glassbacteria bacterium]|nr:ribosome-associated translation inhibitor RaiA [Candidatus Glassbacteria bacterium]
MQINITRKNAGISDSLRSYIESKLQGLEYRYQKIVDAQVLMSEEGRDNFVEISLHITGVTLFAKGDGANLRAAFDSCVDKLDRQLSKKKSRIRRKSLTQEEAILSGKLIAEERRDEAVEEEVGQPVLTFDPDEELDQQEERTGT